MKMAIEKAVMDQDSGVSNGKLYLEKLLNEEQMAEQCGLYARCTLEVGA